MGPNEPGPTGDDDPQPPFAEPRRNPPDLALSEGGEGGGGDSVLDGGKGSRYGGIGLGWAETGESGLEDEESGANENADEDEQEPLFFEDVVDGSGERSRVLESFGRVRGG